MKKKLIPALMLTALIAPTFCATVALTGCDPSPIKTTSSSYDIMPLFNEDKATDYSNKENWMFQETNKGKDVDLVYFYPTVTNAPPEDNYVCPISPEMKLAANYAFAETGSAFESYTNVFAPYYTQAPIEINPEPVSRAGIDITTFDPNDVYCEALRHTQVRTDVYAALDYYFNNFNKGKPFILAGHSQGSAVIKIILEEYMKVHPEFLEKMVAAYVIGFGVEQSYLEENTHLKFAEGETDTGVIVSWNLEGPGTTMSSILLYNGTCKNINPLNWKTDGTYADKSLNKGKLVQTHYLHSWTIDKTAGGDAQIDLTRGSLICKTNTDYESNTGFGDKSLHTYDYAEYYANIKENGLKRIEAFLNK